MSEKIRKDQKKKTIKNKENPKRKFLNFTLKTSVSQDGKFNNNKYGLGQKKSSIFGKQLSILSTNNDFMNKLYNQKSIEQKKRIKLDNCSPMVI